MTDYLYSFSLQLQTRLFLMSLGFGFTAGAIYDFFRALRVLFGNKKAAYVITDIAFSIALGFLNFLFFLAFNGGEFRFFALLGEALGFLSYFFTLGYTFIKYFEILIVAIRRFLTAIFKIIVSPFKHFYRFVLKIVKKYLKIPKKSENKSKYHLKVKHNLLYNHFNRKQFSGNHSEGSNTDAE